MRNEGSATSGRATHVAKWASTTFLTWLGVGALAVAIAAAPADAKKRKPEAQPEEGIADIDTSQPMVLVVSLRQQKLDVYRGMTLVTSSSVSTGMPGHATKAGVFSILEKQRFHHSNIYSGAPMPWMNRITWSGTAFHAGVVPGYPASHGCIRLPFSFAPKLFKITTVGDNVVVARDRPVPQLIEHPALFQPLPPPPAPALVNQQPPQRQSMNEVLPLPAPHKPHPGVLARADVSGTTTDVPSSIGVEATQSVGPSLSADQPAPVEDTHSHAFDPFAGQPGKPSRRHHATRWTTRRTALRRSRVSPARLRRRRRMRPLPQFRSKPRRRSPPCRSKLPRPRQKPRFLRLCRSRSRSSPPRRRLSPLPSRQSRKSPRRPRRSRRRLLRLTHPRPRRLLQHACPHSCSRDDARACSRSGGAGRGGCDPRLAPRAPGRAGRGDDAESMAIASVEADAIPSISASKLGAGTKAAAVQAAEPRSTAPLRILVTRRTNSDRIIGVQTILASMGYLEAQNFDGTLGKATAGAIKDFQRNNGMAETGTFNEELVKKVYEVAGKGEPPVGHLFVRQEFGRMFDGPVTFKDPETPLGTHIFTALKFAPGDTKTQWMTISVQGDDGTAVLDRIEIPADLRQKISERLTPGSSLIVGDTAINTATLTKGSDFLVWAKDTPAKITSASLESDVSQPKPRKKKRTTVRRNNYDYSYRSQRAPSFRGYPSWPW